MTLAKTAGAAVESEMAIWKGWPFGKLFATRDHINTISTPSTTMPRKRSQKYAELEVRIAQAIDAIKKSEVKSIYAAHKKYHVSYNTLSRRIQGGSNHAEGHESTQLLSQAEEEALLLWCRRLTAGGYPARHSVIREMACEILTRRNASINMDGMQLITPSPIGKEWVK
jgi:hypothetical protein